jgi:hypothetical protein
MVNIDRVFPRFQANLYVLILLLHGGENLLCNVIFFVFIAHGRQLVRIDKLSSVTTIKASSAIFVYSTATFDCVREINEGFISLNKQDLVHFLEKLFQI